MPVPPITKDQIRLLAYTPSDRIVAGIVDNQAWLERAAINTPLRLCHFMAQIAFESAGLRVTREFASGIAYEGRYNLGNTEPGDGPRFKGRGLIQITGRANYGILFALLREVDPAAPDFVATPESLEQFPWALAASVEYWRRTDINRFADADDVLWVTRAVNGGILGLQDRTTYLQKAKTIWLRSAPSDQSAAPAMVLRRGDNGDPVSYLQNTLLKLGYHLVADGVFGPHTEDTVRDLQDAHNLTPDGVVGPETWKLLAA